MGWFRAKNKWGGRLALFALAVQFILAFGHIHPADIYGSLNDPFPTQAISLAAANQTQFLSSDQPTAAVNDFCAICATVSLLAVLAAIGGPPTVAVSDRIQSNLLRAGLNYRLPVAW